MPPCPHTSTTLPTINTPTRAGYVCYSQSTWTDHHSHLKPTVCVRVHSRCCIGSQRVRRTRPSDFHSLTHSRFYNLWVWTHTQRHVCTTAVQHRTVSLSQKVLCLLPIPSSSCLQPLAILLLSPQSCLFLNVIQLEPYYVTFLDWLLSLSTMHVFPPCLSVILL